MFNKKKIICFPNLNRTTINRYLHQGSGVKIILEIKLINEKKAIHTNVPKNREIVLKNGK